MWLTVYGPWAFAAWPHFLSIFYFQIVDLTRPHVFTDRCSGQDGLQSFSDSVKTNPSSFKSFLKFGHSNKKPYRDFWQKSVIKPFHPVFEDQIQGLVQTSKSCTTELNSSVSLCKKKKEEKNPQKQNIRF